MDSASPLITRLDRAARRLPRPVLCALGLGVVVLIAAFDAASHHSLPLATFYVVPVLLTAWLTASEACGILVAAAACLVAPLAAFGGALPAGPPPPGPVLPVLGAAAEFLVYLVLLRLLSALGASLEARRAQALRDGLTGLANGRALRAAAAAEIDRCRRYRRPLSLLYLDLDGFKSVNDRLGHAEGDRLLRELGAVLRDRVRAVDVAARLGGDEFCVLLPETGAAEAERLARRLLGALGELEARDGGHLACSAGLVTSRSAPRSVEALLESGDRLMYVAKAKGKGRLEAAVLPGAPEALAGAAGAR